MVVARKIDSFNNVYFEFNGESHLYFINGYVKPGYIEIYIGAKVLYTNLSLLFKVVHLCIINFNIVKLHIGDYINIFHRGDLI